MSDGNPENTASEFARFAKRSHKLGFFGNVPPKKPDPPPPSKWARFWRRFWALWTPLLRLELEIPFVSIATALYYRKWHNGTLSYLVWHIRIFRWRFIVDFYDTEERSWLRRKDP